MAPPILPDGFVEAVRNRRLLPFIGAGFSKNIDRGLPNWSEVIRRSAGLLDYDADVLTTQGDYLQIAEYLEFKHRLGELYTDLAKTIDSDALDVGKSRAHLLLPYLDVQSIFTTNWDGWIEKGFQHQAIPFSKIVTHHDFVKPRTYPVTGSSAGFRYSRTDLPRIRTHFSASTIVKFHGDFSEPTSIVFKESDYFDRLDFDHPLDLKLRSEIIGRSVVFIGYSLSDLNVRFIWHKLTKAMQAIDVRERATSFFVTHLSNPLQTELLRRQNIETILLNPKSISDDLADLLETVVALQLR